MTRIANLLLCLALAAFLCFGGGAREPASPPRPGARPGIERVVSLAPNFTEILLYLGLGDRIAGVTVFCAGVDPEVARVGSFLEPDFERILSLRPDLVLAFRGNEQAPLFQGLARHGLRVEVFAGESIDDLRATVSGLGAMFDAEARAAEFIERLDAALAAAAPGPAAPRVLFVVDHRPLYVAGGGSFVDAMLAAAGAANLFHDRSEPWLPVELEEVVARDPDVIIDVTLPPDADAAGEPWGRFRSHLRAVRAGRVWPFPQVYCGIQVPDWIVRLREIVLH